MSWHPAIGDYRQQLPRIAVIAAMFAAAATLIALHQQRAALPAERWYELSRQQVMEADLAWRLGDAIEQLGADAAFAGSTTAQEMHERAIAGWERRTLARRPSHAAALRLGVAYGHRGYPEQAAEMFALAASLDEDSSDYYHAISEAYSVADLSSEALREKADVIATREGWLTDLALTDVYGRMGADDLLAEVAQRRRSAAMRFAGGLMGIGVVAGLLFLLGVITLAVLIFRWGFRLRKAVARVPFIVPWRLIDVIEVVAVLLFTMVVGGMLTSLALERVLKPDEWSLGLPLLMGIQYIIVSAATLAVVLYRVRPHATRPFNTLGLRVRDALRLVGNGVSGYAAFLTLTIAVVLVAGQLLGDSLPLGRLLTFGQTTEEIIGSAQTPGEVAIYFVLVCILAPIFEELTFRGFVFGGLRRFLPVRSAIIIGGAAFAAVHLNGEAFLMIGLLGAMLCYLYERSRSLLPGMVAHGLHNGLVLAIMLLQSS